MERPFGPLGAATQSTGATMADEGAMRPAPLNPSRRAQNPLRHGVSMSSLSTQLTQPMQPQTMLSSTVQYSPHASISATKVVALAREAMKLALAENKTKTAEANSTGTELKPGVGITIDLSHRQIHDFPDEVVDIIKDDIERLALGHNQITKFPLRFAECSSLRYLNVRNNQLSDFPLPICQLTSLEILDMGRNKIRIIPPELGNLTSLKVLSLLRNRIEELPLCIGDITSLAVLRTDGNPITFPPKEILQPQASSPPNGTFQEVENDEKVITSQIKKFLKQKATQERSEIESAGDESSEGGENPRFMKRVGASGRFPIKVSGAEAVDQRSPALPRAPPIPSRSHYRGLSQQNAALRGQSVTSLTINNGASNERLRSNSESLSLALRDRPDRSADRSRRMGRIAPKLSSDLGTVDETQANRFSHYRGLSHGSAMQGNPNGANGDIPQSDGQTDDYTSPRDPLNPRATYTRRLSSLPERKSKSVSADPVIESSKGILFALFQAQHFIRNLLDLARDGTNRRTSLERVFYNASTHIEEIDRDLQAYMASEEDDEAALATNENVYRACMTCVVAYIHVCGLLSSNIETLLDNGDPRYIRTLLLQMYGSLIEVSNAGTSLYPQLVVKAPQSADDTTSYQARSKLIAPSQERPPTNSRSRSATAILNGTALRVATDAPRPVLGRATTTTGATPRSEDSFVSPNLPTGKTLGGDFTEEDRLFENVFLHLQESVDIAMRSLPTVNNLLISSIGSSQPASGKPSKPMWQIMIQKCSFAIANTEALRARLSSIKLKEPGVRSQSQFWELCSNFVGAYLDLAAMVKEAKRVHLQLPPDIMSLLRPLQKQVSATMKTMSGSPWAFMCNLNGTGTGSYGMAAPPPQTQLPMTPQSAALGPAVQATVPSTPQSASFNAMFSGNVFERAEALLSMNGGTMSSSRAGTMTSYYGNDPNNEGTMNPNRTMNFRYPSNGKVSY